MGGERSDTAAIGMTEVMGSAGFAEDTEGTKTYYCYV